MHNTMTTRAPTQDQMETLLQRCDARSRRLALAGALWSAGGLEETIGLRTVQAELLGLAQETVQAGLQAVAEAIAGAAETLGWCSLLQHTQPLQMGRRILVLDDNEVTSDLIAVALAGVGCVVSVSSTLSECIQRFVDFGPELILLEPAHPDIEAMPSLDAFRKRLKSSFVPVIL